MRRCALFIHFCTVVSTHQAQLTVDFCEVLCVSSAQIPQSMQGYTVNEKGLLERDLSTSQVVFQSEVSVVKPQINREPSFYFW